jgi:hypothetical protein
MSPATQMLTLAVAEWAIRKRCAPRGRASRNLLVGDTWTSSP